MSTRVLLVDDDPAFRRLCGLALQRDRIECVAVDCAADALRALDVGSDPRFDVILLDMEMPGMKGWELVKLLRDRGLEIPVVLVSVREGLEDKVMGLDLGADDYVVKPCAFDELVTRLHAVLRRIRRRTTLRVGDLQIDPVLRRVSRGDVELNLTPREFALLQVLVAERGRVVPKADFMSRIWNLDAEPTANALQVHMSRLKRKLRRAQRVRIETVSGLGYRMIEELPEPGAASGTTRPGSPPARGPTGARPSQGL